MMLATPSVNVDRGLGERHAERGTPRRSVVAEAPHAVVDVAGGLGWGCWSGNASGCRVTATTSWSRRAPASEQSTGGAVRPEYVASSLPSFRGVQRGRTPPVPAMTSPRVAADYSFAPLLVPLRPRRRAASASGMASCRSRCARSRRLILPGGGHVGSRRACERGRRRIGAGSGGPATRRTSPGSLRAQGRAIIPASRYARGRRLLLGDAHAEVRERLDRGESGGARSSRPRPRRGS